MKSVSITRILALGLTLATAIAGSGSVLAAATADQALGGKDWLPDISLVYVDTAFGPAIHSYQNLKGVERKVANPQIVYVDQAYGQAIYSYPRVARDTVFDFNLHYIDTQHGPAIYSYPGLKEPPAGEVIILPLEPVMPN